MGTENAKLEYLPKNKLQSYLIKMHYIGVDIVEIARINKAIARWGEDFLNRVYTEAELKLCRDKAASLAARFAGKEAVMKAIHTEGMSWKEIEILAESNGKPLLLLRGKLRQHARKIGLAGLSISLSHSREYAIAFVSGETP